MTIDWGKHILQQNLSELDGLEKWATNNGIAFERRTGMGDSGVWAILGKALGRVEISIVPPAGLDTISKALGRWGLRISYEGGDVFDVLVPNDQGWQLNWSSGVPVMAVRVENVGTYLLARLREYFRLEVATAAAQG
jgi:hypothetical protein